MGRLTIIGGLIAGLLAATPALATPSDLDARQTGIGTRLFNTRGYSLYVYARDPAGQTTCYDACSKAWPPLIASKDAKADGDWTLIVRKDGAGQWAYKGHALYTFARDPGPGASLGDGVQDIWRLAVDLRPHPKAIVFQGSVAGWLAANSNGMTLYIHDGESASSRKHCDEACLQKWKPVVAPAIANPIGDWSAILRADGITQWAYRGLPLYTYADDATRGQTAGDGLNREWHALLLESAPALPSWVQLQASDYGTILADEHHMTLYTIADYPKISKTLCLEDCLKTYWRPVLAQADAKPTGNWSLVKNSDGMPQWAYRGRLVFTHTRDSRPGEIEGDRFADGIADFGWNVIQAETLVVHSF